MKKILALILAISVICGTLFSFTSCSMSEILGFIENGGFGDNIPDDDDPIKDEPGEDKPGEDGPGNDNPSNDNPGNDDSGNDDSGNGDSGNDNPGNDDSGNGDSGNDNTGNTTPPANNIHVDVNNDDYCDDCNEYLIVVLDFYVFNDLHGNFCDSDSQPGVDEIGTYFENMSAYDDHMILLSSGDMWQGSAESSMTKGVILTEWMNLLGFTAMTLGNHEFDWGEDAIRDNLAVAEFPFLAINIYNNSTGKLADYCTPSIMIEKDGLQIGIIGAIGDCYSSISSDKVEDVYFKTGSALTSLVQAESNRLREAGADLIVYSLHDGTSGYSSALAGYVDIVFEGHTHSEYITVDGNGIYHIQTDGENKGIAHAEIAVNKANGNKKINQTNIISSNDYKDLADHQPTEDLEAKYGDLIELAYTDLGVVSRNYSDSEIEAFMAQLYLEAGLEKWGSKYNIVLGGGFIRTREPYNLTAGVKRYADLASLFPFDNEIVLCTISGSNLKSQFINSTSSDYYIAYSSYGSGLSISNNATYYVVVDMYTAAYSRNGLTVVDYYDHETFARDLLKDAISEGRLEINHDDYTLTSIPDALAIGNKLTVGKSTSESYYIKGKIVSITNTSYGNLYIEDEKGNRMQIYGLYDQSGKRYDAMTSKPKVGDTIIVYSTIYRYNSSTVELKNATVIEINP